MDGLGPHTSFLRESTFREQMIPDQEQRCQTRKFLPLPRAIRLDLAYWRHSRSGTANSLLARTVYLNPLSGLLMDTLADSTLMCYAGVVRTDG